MPAAPDTDRQMEPLEAVPLEREIVSLNAPPERSIGEVGGKAVSLIRLSNHRFKVPRGFCITTHAYRRLFMESGCLSPVLRQVRHCDPDDPVEVFRISELGRDVVVRTPLDRALEDGVVAAYQGLMRESAANGYVGVRSSATAEDLPGASFAGQHESFLDVRGRDELIDAVKRSWASAWTARSLSYRNHRGIDDGRVLLAVIVQEMIRCDVSGVLFTENAADGNRDEMVLNVTRGRGERLVLGSTEADEIVLSKATGQSEWRQGAVCREGAPCITEREIQALFVLGRQVEELFGSPQDIEWGIQDGDIYILQARPITSVRHQRLAIIEREKRILSKSPSGTVWSDMLISEVVSFPRPVSGELLRRFLSRDGSFGAFYERELRFGLSFSDEILTFICGRPFLNRTALLRPFSFLGFPLKPFDYALARRDPAAANSLYPTIDAGVLGWRMVAFACRLLVVLPYALGRLAAALHRVTVLAKALHTEFYRDILPRHMQGMAELRRTPLADLPDRELAATVEATLVRIARKSTMSHIRSEFLAELSCFVLRLLVGERANQLMRGVDGDKHLEATIELWKLSRGVTPELAATLTGTCVSDLRTACAASTDGRNFLAQLDAFLDTYGHRTHNEFELAMPRWREAPGVLMEAIKTYLKAQDVDPIAHVEREKRARAREEDTIRDELSGIRRRVFLWALELLHTYVPLRETTKFYYLMEVEHLRRLLLELGGRLAEGSYECLNNEHDVFFLYSRELSRIVARERSSRAVKRLVARRKTEYRLRKTIPVPAVVFRDALDAIGTAPVHETGDVLCGTGVSAGRVTGISKVVMDPSDIGTVEAGEILVAPTTDPGWTPLFLVVRGLVMNTGNLLSHGAILAREYGLPTVVNVADATARIGTGRRITVDGSAGKVYLH